MGKLKCPVAPTEDSADSRGSAPLDRLFSDVCLRQGPLTSVSTRPRVGVLPGWCTALDGAAHSLTMIPGKDSAVNCQQATLLASGGVRPLF